MNESCVEALLDTEAGYSLVRLRGPAAAQLATLSNNFSSAFSWKLKHSITRQALVGESVSIKSVVDFQTVPCTDLLWYCWSSEATQAGLLTLLANSADPNQTWGVEGSEGSCALGFLPHPIYAENFGNRPLHVAVSKHQSISMCKALIYHQADLHAEELSGLNALEFCVKRVHGIHHPKREKMLLLADFLRRQGIVLRRSDLLLTHVWERDVETVRLLLEAGASANDCRSYRYSSPLFVAAGKIGDTVLTRLFLEHAADPTVQNLAGETASQVATKEGHLDAAAVISEWIARDT